MVNIPRRLIELGEDEVVRGNSIYKRKVEPLQTSVQIDPSQYILVQEDDNATYALYLRQQLDNLNFVQMNIEALRKGLLLANVKNVTLHHRNVNLALQGRGAIYDASGNLIEGTRLEQIGNSVNNAWVFLNNSYEAGSGFLGLDVVSITGLDAKSNPIMEKQPLEECVVDCWVDIQEPLNSQGYYTKKAPIQTFEKGKTIYVTRPIEGRVAGFDASSVRALLNCGRDPTYSSAGLGCFLCAKR